MRLRICIVGDFPYIDVPVTSYQPLSGKIRGHHIDHYSLGWPETVLKLVPIFSLVRHT